MQTYGKFSQYILPITILINFNIMNITNFYVLNIWSAHKLPNLITIIIIFSKKKTVDMKIFILIILRLNR